MKKQVYRFYIIPKNTSQFNKERFDQFIKKVIKKTLTEEGLFTVDIAQELLTYVIRSKTILSKENRLDNLKKFVTKIYSTYSFQEEKIKIRNIALLRQNHPRKCKKNNIKFIAING
jgi:hypothetical protein